MISHYVSLAWFHLANYEFENLKENETWIGTKEEAEKMSN